MPAGDEKQHIVQGVKHLLRISPVRTALLQEMQVIINAQRQQARRSLYRNTLSIFS